MAKKKPARNAEHALTEKGAGISVPSDYPQLLAAIKSRIQTARVQAHLAANRELVRLYWDLGRMIREKQEVEGWGKSVIERLSSDLMTEFPDMKGLSLSNLWRMRSFYLAHSQLPAILAQPAREEEKTTENPENLAREINEVLMA